MPLLFPAIDLKDGACVRLKLGLMEEATVYNADPAAQAREFRDAGFSHLHVVDLNGAFEGRAVNGAEVEAILAELGAARPKEMTTPETMPRETMPPETMPKGSMKVQLGGGIRTMAEVERWLAAGLSRVILGTVAVRDPALVRDAARRFPGQVAVGIDAKGGRVAVEGWAESSELTAVDLAGRFEDAGVAAIIYTDIDRDGILAGINWDATIALGHAVSIPVIASGGLASMEDIERLAGADAAHLEGAISGRALYDGRIDARQALARLA